MGSSDSLVCSEGEHESEACGSVAASKVLETEDLLATKETFGSAGKRQERGSGKSRGLGPSNFPCLVQSCGRKKWGSGLSRSCGLVEVTCSTLPVYRTPFCLVLEEQPEATSEAGS